MTWNRAWPVDVDGQVAQLVDDQQPGVAYRAQLRVEPAPTPSQTLGDKLRRVYDEIDEWRSRPLESEYPYVFVDGVWHKRSWGGSVENAGILVAIGVDPEGHREVIGVAGGMREDAAGWEQSVRGMIERGLKVVRLVVGDRCAGPVATVNPHAPRGEMPAVHGALHAQRAFEDAAKPQGLGFRGVEGRVRHGIPETALAKAEQVAAEMEGGRLKAAADCLRGGSARPPRTCCRSSRTGTAGGYAPAT